MFARLTVKISFNMTVTSGRSQIAPTGFELIPMFVRLMYEYINLLLYGVYVDLLTFKTCCDLIIFGNIADRIRLWVCPYELILLFVMFFIF